MCRCWGFGEYVACMPTFHAAYLQLAIRVSDGSTRQDIPICGIELVALYPEGKRREVTKISLLNQGMLSFPSWLSFGVFKYRIRSRNSNCCSA